jgi:GH15 family glucan-1,4-alpha-glucosidase
MSLKQQLIAAVLLAVVSFAFGRYSNMKPEVTQKIEAAKDVETVKNTKKTITTVKDKDGNEKTVTVIDSTTDTKAKEVFNSSTQTKALPKYHAVYMLGIDKDENHTQGVMISANFIGPVTLGVFGMNNKNYGFTLGLDF